MKEITWAIMVIGVFGIFSHYLAQSSIEDGKRHSEMMTACVKSGGEWVKNFGPSWNCVRK